MKKPTVQKKHFGIRMKPNNGGEEFLVVIENVYNVKEAIQQARDSQPNATANGWVELNKVH